MNTHAAPFPTKAVASCFALAAFAIAIVTGLGAGRAASSILITAIAALFICQIVGVIAAAVMEVAVREHVKQYKAALPIPESDPPPNNPAQPPQPEQTE